MLFIVSSPAPKYTMVVLICSHDKEPEAVNRHLMCSEFRETEHEPHFFLRFSERQWSCMRRGYCLNLASAD